MLKLMHKQRKY